MVHFETRFPVRYYEADPMGVVHHSNYLRYFECARDEMIESWGYGIEKWQEEGIVFPVVAADIKFRHSLHPGDTVVAIAEIHDMPLAKLIIHQKVCNQDGVICAEGVITLGFLDTETGHVTRCPEKMKEMIERNQTTL